MSTVIVKISVQSDRGGLSAAGSDSIASAGVELSLKAVTHTITLPYSTWIHKLGHLAARWKPAEGNSELSPDGSGRLVVRLRVPTALFAGALASALCFPPAYTLSPKTQFTFATTAHIVRDMARLLQCHRFIARNFSTASFVHAMRAATSPVQPLLLLLGLQWLRRTGGITPGYLLTNPDKQILCDVDRGLLVQGYGDNEVIFDLRWWSSLVRAERARKRKWYIPVECISLSEWKQRRLSRQEGYASIAFNVDGGKLYNDNIEPAVVDALVNVEAELEKHATSPKAADGPQPFSDAVEDTGVFVAANRVLQECIGVMEAGTVGPEIVIPKPPVPSNEADSATRGSTSGDDTAKLFSGPGAGFPGMVRCYIVRRRDGQGPCRVMHSGPADGLTGGVSQAMPGIGSGAVTAYTGAITAGANGEEWDGIVTMQLGSDGDENLAAEEARTLAPHAALERMVPWMAVQYQRHNTNLVTADGLIGETSETTSAGCLQFHRKTPFDCQILQAADARQTWEAAMLPTVQHGPCPLHDGARPIHSVAQSNAFDDRRYFSHFDDDTEDDEDGDFAVLPSHRAVLDETLIGSGTASEAFPLIRAAVKPYRVRRVGEAVGTVATPNLEDIRAGRRRCTCISNLWEAPAGTLRAAAAAMQNVVEKGKVGSQRSFGCRHIYELRREIDDSLIMVAAATSESGKFVFSSSTHMLQLPGHAGSASTGSDPEHYIGTTSCNMLGTSISCYDWGMPVDLHAATSAVRNIIGSGPAGPLIAHPDGILPELMQRELCRILYDTNIFASAPNRMTVELRPHDVYDVDKTIHGEEIHKPEHNEEPFSSVALFGVTGADSTGSLVSIQSHGDGRRVGPVPIPSFSASGPLSTPSDINLRMCSPSTGFGVGLGATTGAGSWGGLLASTWKSWVGASAEPEVSISASPSKTLSRRAVAIPASTVLVTRQPRWNERLEAWTMDFKGRATRASKKNFQLVVVPMGMLSEQDEFAGDHSTAPALLFGKVAKDRFSLDFDGNVLGAYQAFAVALSTFASKLAVA